MLYTFLRLSMFSIVQKIKMIKAPSSRALWQMRPLLVVRGKGTFFCPLFSTFTLTN